MKQALPDEHFFAQKEKNKNGQLVLLQAALAEKRAKRRQDKLVRLARMNKSRCDVRPVYGQDLCDTVDILLDCAEHKDSTKPGHVWNGPGYVHCHKTLTCTNPHHPDSYWTQTHALRDMLHTPEDYSRELQDILQR